MFEPDMIVQYLLMIPVMLISLTVHEYSHARVAYAMGDATARNMGRVSLNPLRHLDPIGAICMIFFRFGWAKPVPINTRNFDKPRQGMALVALSGPISNLLLSFFGAFMYLSLVALGNRLLAMDVIVYNTLPFNLFKMLITFFALFHYANITLAVFNLIPIPPLDGSRILTLILPPKLYWDLMKYEQYFGLILMILVFLGSFSGVIGTVTGWISNGMFNILEFLPFL